MRTADQGGFWLYCLDGECSFSAWLTAALRPDYATITPPTNTDPGAQARVVLSFVQHRTSHSADHANMRTGEAAAEVGTGAARVLPGPAGAIEEHIAPEDDGDPESEVLELPRARSLVTSSHKRSGRPEQSERAGPGHPAVILFDEQTTDP